MRCSSCETRTTQPSKRLMPWISASTASMSRWLLGSSSSSTCGRLKVTRANATRLFCPPDSLYMRCMASSLGTPKEDRWLRIFSSGQSGNSCSRHSSGQSARSRPSTWCCENVAMRTVEDVRISPLVAASSPVISFSSVVLPAPFAPTSAMRLCGSTPKLTFFSSISSSLGGTMVALPSPASFFLLYPKETSSKEMRDWPPAGPGEGKVKTYSGSSATTLTSPMRFRALMRDCTMVARLALARNLLMKASTWARLAAKFSLAFFSVRSRSLRSFSKSE
mmetsp:Transcript_36510/g.79158  ORF Transcript_36510/g.79158 Transcript_36510/m.79158 type:complete len:278 (-) Transcript_36510:194-1027(-)